jgi:restriction system protein
MAGGARQGGVSAASNVRRCPVAWKNGTTTDGRSMIRMWMVRAEGGRLYDAFRGNGLVALGWMRLAPLAEAAESRDRLIEAYAALEPGRPRSSLVSGASQVWRFAHEVQTGDWVVTYSPRRRVYLIGSVLGPARHRPEGIDDGMPLARAVEWLPAEVPRDALRPATRNSLGPTQTMFRVSPGAARQVLLAAHAPRM